MALNLKQMHRADAKSFIAINVCVYWIYICIYNCIIYTRYMIIDFQTKLLLIIYQRQLDNRPSFFRLKRMSFRHFMSRAWPHTFCYLTDLFANNFAVSHVCQLPLLNSITSFCFILLFSCHIMEKFWENDVAWL